MPRTLVVAMNVFHGLLSKRALYVWGAAVLLMLLRSGPAIFFSDRNPATEAFVRANAIAAALDTWAILALAAAVFLGAASVGGEKTHKTIAAVLARPLHRWAYMLGHWLGVVIFSLVSLGIGLVLASVLSWYMGIAIDAARAGIAVAETTAAVVLFAAAGVALGANASTALAAVVTVLFAFMPPVVETLRTDTRPWQHYPGVALHYLTPPGYTSHYMGIAWADPRPAGIVPGARRRVERPTVDYGAAAQRVATNAVYGMFYFLIGAIVFTRKDLKLG
jgi:ABC-type transport system involved in multi-copper enzyme maturation permease subunit